ncbi:MAG TPA: DUF1549 domain-containing protein, partial [Verrucomicrobiae bacterium]|nr:DUF1549 domain-containing protein [Verrucomicrobiae bacterium]
MVSAILLTSLPALRATAEVEFNRDIRPLLGDACLACHGPDSAARKAGLRLDTQAGLYESTDKRGPAVVAGKLEESELWRRIISDDPDDLMPPPESKMSLTEEQKKLLQTWVSQGAEYTPHWAFEAPKKQALPKVRQSEWPRNAIDYFVLQRLEAEGLAPSPEADRHALVRRLYLDLIGLPPTPEEAEKFLQDTNPRSYEDLVDRLLASPHYGERWARRWLDLARYADTNG